MNSDLNIPAVTGQVKTKELDAKSKARFEKAARDFESIFVNYMLKSMRSSIQKSEDEENSFGGDMMEGMFDMELAHHISKSSNLGIANMLYKQVTGEALPNVRPTRIERPTAADKAIVAKKEPRANIFSENISLQPILSANTGKPDTLAVRLQKYAPIIEEASAVHGVDRSLIRAVIATESAAKVSAQSEKNAKGLMQLVDTTAAEMGVRDVWDPKENIMGGVKYLKRQLDRHNGDMRHALAAYNAGPGAVAKHGGIPPFRETREYVARVMRYVREFENEEVK